jgi:osmotically-inducible protein OsmY
MNTPQVSDPKDVELEASIQRAIRQLGTGIHVKVWGGHVTLSGHVDDFGTKREIASIVRRMPTIRRVTNNLRVMPGLG